MGKVTVNRTLTATLVAALGTSGCTPVMIKDADGAVVEKPFSSENASLLIPLLAIGIAIAAGNSGGNCGVSSCS
jgi:hypothetical protein